MYLLMILSLVLLTAFHVSGESAEKMENELILEAPVRSLIGILALPVRNRRQSQDAAENEFEDDGIRVVSPHLLVIGLPEPGHEDKVNMYNY